MHPSRNTVAAGRTKRLKMLAFIESSNTSHCRGGRSRHASLARRCKTTHEMANKTCGISRKFLPPARLVARNSETTVQAVGASDHLMIKKISPPAGRDSDRGQCFTPGRRTSSRGLRRRRRCWCGFSRRRRCFSRRRCGSRFSRWGSSRGRNRRGSVLIAGHQQGRRCEDGKDI